MGKEGELPTAEQLKVIRDAIQNMEHNDYDPRDMKKLMKNDYYASRFYLHHFDTPGDQVENAVLMIKETFKWRKHSLIHDLSVSDLNSGIKKAGELFVYGRDMEGKKLLIFCVRRHKKNVFEIKAIKDLFHYLLERIERESNGDQLTFVFDCANAGLRNLDMEIIQYMIKVFTDYYPWSLNYILVYEMPWILNAAWKIIRSWLPPAAVNRIKFLSKSSLRDFVDPNQQSVEWAENPDWVYTWEDEHLEEDIRIPVTPSSTTPVKMVSFRYGDDDDGYDDEDVRRQRSPSSGHSLPPIVSDKIKEEKTFFTPRHEESSSSLVVTHPTKEILFQQDSSGQLRTQIELRNTSMSRLVFKVKTTSPEKYRVRGGLGCLEALSTRMVEIFVCGPPPGRQTEYLSSLCEDKFRIGVIDITDRHHQDFLPLEQSSLTDLFKKTKPVELHTLRCLVDNLSFNEMLPNRSQHYEQQLDNLLKQMTSLSEVNNRLLNDVKTVKAFVTLCLGMVTCLLWLMFF